MDTMVADSLLGRTVDGRYRVESRIAVGGMAAVYLATDLRLDRPVALKVMREQWADDPEFRSRFHAEARAAARLTQTNAVGVYDQGEWDGKMFLVMEYVPGRNLRAVLRDFSRVSPAQSLAVLDQVLLALEAAHTAGFIHRDIKPENILITDDDTVKVTDFGLARALQSPSQATVGLLLGTAAYLSPEQVSGNPADERSDVYQAGVLLFELLTGQTPFSGETSWAVANQHVQGRVPDVTELVPDCPAGLAALVAAATVRDPDERLGSIDEFRRRVSTLRQELPPAEPLPHKDARTDAHTSVPVAATAQQPETPAEQPVVEVGRNHPWRVGIAITLLAVALAVAVGWLIAVNPFDRTDVPDVVGTKESAATSTLTAAGFSVAVTDRRFSEKVAVGDVIETDPEPESGARTGSEVGMVVSLGPERYEVPKVRGETPEAAAQTLAATNLAVARERKQYHDTVAAGMVIGTDPAKGTEVKRDTGVVLFVSKGPAPVDVPDVSGTGSATAKSQLQDLGLKVTTSTQESQTVPEGSVIQTIPAAGTTVYRGDKVELVVSEGPPPVPVPDVVDMTREEAIAALKAAGFTVEVSEGVVTPLDRVFESDPSPGSMAPVGSTVTISVF